MRVYLALCLPNALACGNLALTLIKNVSVQVGQFPTRGNSLTPWCSHLTLLSVYNSIFGVMYCHILSNVVCIMASKELWFDLILPESILPVFHRHVWISTCYFFRNGVMSGEAMVLYYFLASLKQLHLLHATSGPWLMDNSSASPFHSTVSNIAKGAPGCGHEMFVV